MWAVMLMIGFASGNTQPAAFVVPELLPNKWRHTAIVIADAIITVAVIIGPIAGRFSVVDVASEAVSDLTRTPGRGYVSSQLAKLVFSVSSDSHSTFSRS